MMKLNYNYRMIRVKVNIVSRESGKRNGKPKPRWRYVVQHYRPESGWVYCIWPQMKGQTKRDLDYYRHKYHRKYYETKL